jgi:DNA anti-recombination protein RmuC
MNAGRLARHLIQDGVDPKLAQSLSEHLAEEVEQTVATRDQVETIVTREVQTLRVEMHQSLAQLRSDLESRLTQLRSDVDSRLTQVSSDLTNRMVQLSNDVNNRLTSQFRWLLSWLALVSVGILVDLLK